MSISYNPGTYTSGLELCLDVANPRSYPGSGSTWKDISGNGNIFSSTDYTYPTINGFGLTKYFVFVNNGTTVNQIYCSSPTISTYNQLQYTRIGWFYLTGYNAWSPVIQNSIGNNSDMCLCVSDGKIAFHQYTTTLDYTVLGSTPINLNTWYQGAIVVNRSTNSLSFYVNGSLDSTVAITGIGNSASNTILIGGTQFDGYGGDRMFKGYISSVFHYNTVLTTVQIAQNFNAFRGRYGI